MLTEGAVRAFDKRAQFVGIEAYEGAGGVLLRDLFNSDDGGWLQDPVLFAHCVALTVNAVSETYNRRPKAIAHADRLAQAVGLDVAAIGWRPTVENYLSRVTKGRILAACRT